MANKPDFRNGIHIKELDKERAERAEEIREFMKEQSNNRKTGKAKTGELAIDLAWQCLQALDEEEGEAKSELREVMDFKKSVVDNV